MCTAILLYKYYKIQHIVYMGWTEEKVKKLKVITMLIPIMVAQKFQRKAQNLIMKLYFTIIGIIRMVIGLIRQSTAS